MSLALQIFEFLPHEVRHHNRVQTLGFEPLWVGAGNKDVEQRCDRGKATENLGGPKKPQYLEL